MLNKLYLLTRTNNKILKNDKIKFCIFSILQCISDKDIFCFTNFIRTMKTCKKERLKIIMLHDDNEKEYEYTYCDCDAIALCIENNNIVKYIIDDFCELSYNLNYEIVESKKEFQKLSLKELLQDLF